MLKFDIETTNLKDLAKKMFKASGNSHQRRKARRLSERAHKWAWDLHRKGLVNLNQSFGRLGQVSFDAVEIFKKFSKSMAEGKGTSQRTPRQYQVDDLLSLPGSSPGCHTNEGNYGS